MTYFHLPLPESYIDLFAGAGGCSEGAKEACARDGRRIDDHVGLNHNPVAIASFRANHPEARTFCEDVRVVDPYEATRGVRVRAIGAGVDCTFHSRARGGKPRDAGLMSLADNVTKWAKASEPDHILVENVPEFLQWGPLYPADHPDPKKRNLPIPERRGESFRQWLVDLATLGYGLDWRILRACDYGDPTSRERLFIQASKDRITWPAPTHAAPDSGSSLPAYRTALEIIDFDLPSESIFGRKKPLVEATHARIADGILKLLGEPFLLGIGGPRGRQRVRPLTAPYHTALTRCHDYLCEPIVGPVGAARAEMEQFRHDFLLRYNDGRRIQFLDRPLTTLDTSNRFAVVSAFLVSYHGQDTAHSLAEPLRTLRTKDRFALCEVYRVYAEAEKRLAQRGLALVDIRMRMLAPHEAARAHSFPQGYVIHGTRAQKIAQIGHSWPIGTSTEAWWAMLSGEGIPGKAAGEELVLGGAGGRGEEEKGAAR